MLLISLQSGSNGNAIYVESGDVRLLFDAGISGIQVQERLAAYGRRPQAMDGLFISHDHSDHVRCAGILTRKFGVPLYITERTLAVSKRRAQLGELKEMQHFRAGSATRIKHVTVHAIGTPHDAADGVVFVVDDGTHRVGICTDVGHVFADLASVVAHVDGLFLESNYDEAMLRDGAYHPALKRRISGPGGHIANAEAAELVARHASSRLQWLCIGHLSAENNTPALAMAAHRDALGSAFPLHLAGRHGVSAQLDVAPASPWRAEAFRPPFPVSLSAAGRPRKVPVRDIFGEEDGGKDRRDDRFAMNPFWSPGT